MAGSSRQAIEYDYNNKSNEKQVKETVSNMESELDFSLQHPHKSNSSLHKGKAVTFTLSLSTCLSTHAVLFFPPNQYLFVSLLPDFVGSQRVRTLSQTIGLVARILCSRSHRLTSISGWKLKPCFKPPNEEEKQLTHDTECSTQDVGSRLPILIKHKTLSFLSFLYSGIGM